MITDNIRRIKQEIGRNVALVVVSKFRSVEEIKQAYDCGHRMFAENRVQSLLERYQALPHDISWHLIGHLQTNKVKAIIPFIAMIQSADSVRLAAEISKEAVKAGRIIPCLLQIKLTDEDTKSGFAYEELRQSLQSGQLLLPGIQWCGVMGMAELSNDLVRIASQFENLKHCFEALKKDYFATVPEFKEISMGMSGDYKLAVEKGSTMVRVGSAVFD